MARLPRLYVPGCSHHIIQRGNNRDACFFDEQDYAFYLQQLQISAEQFGVAIHAFVLKCPERGRRIYFLINLPFEEKIH